MNYLYTLSAPGELIAISEQELRQPDGRPDRGLPPGGAHLLLVLPAHPEGDTDAVEQPPPVDVRPARPGSTRVESERLGRPGKTRQQSGRSSTQQKPILRTQKTRDALIPTGECESRVYYRG